MIPPSSDPDAGRTVLASLEAALRPLDDPSAVMATVAVRLGSHLAVNRCAYATVEADQEHVIVTDDYVDGAVVRRGRYRLAAFGPFARDTLRAGRALCVEDSLADPRLSDADRAAFAAGGSRAIVAVPLTKDDRVVAGMSVQQSTPRRWTDAEIALVHDVAERCWETLERLHAERRAAREHRHAELAMRAGRMGVWDWNLDTGERHWSAGVFALYGFDPAHGTPPAERFLAIIDDEDRVRMLAEMARLCERGGETELEFRIRRADTGEPRWILTRGALIRDGDGHGALLTGVSLDHTPRKRAESRLLEADARKDEFLAMLAHELRNPLAPLTNALALLARSGGLDARDRGLVAMADRQTRQLHRLVDDLLEVSRITRGMIELRTASMSIADAVRGAIESVAPHVAQRRQRLDAIGLDDASRIVADAARIAQVLENLLNNASKYTPEGGSIRIEVDERADDVEVRVVDEGVGIAPDELALLFVPFSQVGTTLDRAEGGLGLGLALVRQLVEMHGGDVRADSRGRGSGATFTVRLPRLARVDAR